MNNLNILLIGLGNMGNIHKRIIENTKNVSLVGILDSSFPKEVSLNNKIKRYNKFSQINFEDEKIDGVVISSTTATHYGLAKKILALRIPVFIEKPVSTNVDEVNELVETAKRKKIVLRAGLIEIYNPIFRHIKKLDLKDIISIHAFRHSQKVDKERKLENVIYDLALHDISVLFYLFGDINLKLSGKLTSSKNKTVETSELLLNHKQMNLFISASRQSQLKTRKWNIATSDKVYQIDLIEKRIDVFESGSVKFPNSNLISEKSNFSTLSFANQPETAQIQFDAFISNIIDGNIDKEHLKILTNSHKLVSDIV
jgi:UDP-N-acetylglucosamine 3-dehydrogenase